jgi:hypothetical protein
MIKLKIVYILEQMQLEFFFTPSHRSLLFPFLDLPAVGSSITNRVSLSLHLYALFCFCPDQPAPGKKEKKNSASKEHGRKKK